MKKNIYRCVFLEKDDIITWKLNESEEKFLNYLISINIFPKDKWIIEKVEEEKNSRVERKNRSWRHWRYNKTTKKKLKGYKILNATKKKKKRK